MKSAVLVKMDDLKRLWWPLDTATKIIPGRDQKICLVEFKVGAKILPRLYQRIYWCFYFTFLFFWVFSVWCLASILHSATIICVYYCKREQSLLINNIVVSLLLKCLSRTRTFESCYLQSNEIIEGVVKAYERTKNGTNR